MASDDRHLNVQYRAALLPHRLDLRLPDDSGWDLNLAEEVLAPLGLFDLNRASRVLRAL